MTNLDNELNKFSERSANKIIELSKSNKTIDLSDESSYDYLLKLAYDCSSEEFKNNYSFEQYDQRVSVYIFSHMIHEQE